MACCQSGCQKQRDNVTVVCRFLSTLSVQKLSEETVSEGPSLLVVCMCVACALQVLPSIEWTPTPAPQPAQVAALPGDNADAAVAAGAAEEEDSQDEADEQVRALMCACKLFSCTGAYIEMRARVCVCVFSLSPPPCVVPSLTSCRRGPSTRPAVSCCVACHA
jgi:hypothetical protein